MAAPNARQDVATKQRFILPIRGTQSEPGDRDREFALQLSSRSAGLHPIVGQISSHSIAHSRERSGASACEFIADRIAGNSLVLRCKSSVAFSSVASALGRESPKNTLVGVFKDLRRTASSSVVQRMRQRFANQ